MTEIRFDVDLDHPPERVWRALTDPHQFGEWFVPVEVDPAHRTRLTLRPQRLDGLSGPLAAEVVVAESPHRLVMRWQGEDLHVRVAITIADSEGGSRLTFVQRGFLGRRGTLRRRVLRATYARLFAERLPRALDRFAGQEPTVLIAARLPPPPTSANAGSAGRGSFPAVRRNVGGFQARRVRRAEVPAEPAVEAVPPSRVPTRRGRHSAPETAEPAGPAAIALRSASPVPDRRRAIPEQAGGPAHRAPESVDESRAARGVAAVPSASAWLAAQPAGRRHRAMAVPYRRGGGHRSIRRFVAVRPVAGGPAYPMHAAGARRRRPGGSHGARSSIAGGLAAWLRPGPEWTPERRSRAAAISATLLLVFAVSAVIAARMVPSPPRAAPPQVGGAAQPPPGFALAPAVPGDTGAGRLASASPLATPSATAAVPTTDPTTSASATPAATAGSGLSGGYRTASTWIGGYRGEVTVNNSGEAQASGWTVSITLPLLGLAVRTAQGAEFRQSGRTVVFTPTADTRTVGPRGSVRFEFTVDGVGEPTGCTLDGRTCAGLPG